MSKCYWLFLILPILCFLFYTTPLNAIVGGSKYFCPENIIVGGQIRGKDATFDKTPSGLDLNTCLNLCKSNNAEACNYGWGGNDADRHCESEHSGHGNSLYVYNYPGINPVPYDGTQFSGWSYVYPQDNPCSSVDGVVLTPGKPFTAQPVPAPPTQGLPTNMGQLIQQIFAWSLGILGISVFVMFFYSGFLWLTAAGNTSKIGEAKTHMTNAVLGAILLLSSYLILYTINPDFVENTVNLPGLGKISPNGKGEQTVPGQVIPTTSLLSDLQSERAKYGATITHEEAGKILNAVAWKNKDVSWGLLSKSGAGNNCPLNGTGQPISCDWLLHKQSGLGLDVFSDGPGTVNGAWVNGEAKPQWGDGYPESNWVAPVAP